MGKLNREIYAAGSSQQPLDGPSDPHKLEPAVQHLIGVDHVDHGAQAANIGQPANALGDAFQSNPQSIGRN